MEVRDTHWISVSEVVNILDVVRNTVDWWIDTKGIPAHRVSQFWKFQLSEVEPWIKLGEANFSKGASPDERLGDAMQRV